VDTAKKYDNLVVFIQNRPSASCVECETDLPKGTFVRIQRETGVCCLECADLDHLEFLPSGNIAVTRRAAKYSKIWAVVVKWSSTRHRNERQGILAEPEAIDRAQDESEADSAERERRRQREAVRREKLDRDYVDQFAKAIREQFSHIPKGIDIKIAEHACLKYSGRVGRSAAAKSFDPEAVFLAVRAHARHAFTDYDDLLFKYDNRQLARERVRERIEAVLDKWRAK
jgi:hypothetical protein